MATRVKAIVTEPFDAYEIMKGEVTDIPLLLKTEDGRVFSLFPHHGLLDLINWFRKGRLVVDMADKRSGSLLRGTIERLQ